MTPTVRDSDASGEPADRRRAPATERKIVVAHREDLWWLLTEHAQLEHMIMCHTCASMAADHDGAPSAITEAAQRTRSVAARVAGHLPRELLGAPASSDGD